MSEKKVIIEVKDWGDSDIKVGDNIEYKGEVYEFEGYEYGTNPFARHIETGENTITALVMVHKSKNIK